MRDSALQRHHHCPVASIALIVILYFVTKLYICRHGEICCFDRDIGAIGCELRL